MDLIARRRNVLFVHVARLGKYTPAHQALRRQIDISLGRLPDGIRKRQSGRPKSKRLDQIRSDNNLPPVVLWSCAVRRGHSGMTQWFIAVDHVMMMMTIPGRCTDQSEIWRERAEPLSSLSRQ